MSLSPATLTLLTHPSTLLRHPISSDCQCIRAIMPVIPVDGSLNYLFKLPSETMLYIFSFLDLPELDALAAIHPYLALIATDPVLHLTRLRVITPSRVSHLLFYSSTDNRRTLRPTLGDLINRNIIRGLGIERQWREGSYMYSAHAVRQYEMALHLKRKHIANALSRNLRRRSHPSSESGKGNLDALHNALVLPDAESARLSVSRSLLPRIRKLKWAIQRDTFALAARTGSVLQLVSTDPGSHDLSRLRLGKWIEAKGQAVVQDNERVRLAICPGVRKIIGHYEQLSRRSQQERERHRS